MLAEEKASYVNVVCEVHRFSPTEEKVDINPTDRKHRFSLSISPSLMSLDSHDMRFF